VAAVLDAFRLGDVTLVGISRGGCLAIRAAAFEPRVRRVVAFDVLSDFFEYMMMSVRPGRVSRGLMRIGADLTAARSITARVFTAEEAGPRALPGWQLAACDWHHLRLGEEDGGKTPALGPADNRCVATVRPVIGGAADVICSL
jgi:pimeloyl-ACP methyl ester carboxylesterase